MALKIIWPWGIVMEELALHEQMPTQQQSNSINLTNISFKQILVFVIFARDVQMEDPKIKTNLSNFPLKTFPIKNKRTPLGEKLSGWTGHPFQP